MFLRSLPFAAAALTLGVLSAEQPRPVQAPPAQISAQYGKLPMMFESNGGQMHAPVRFMSRGKGYSLFLTPTESVLGLTRKGKNADGKSASLRFRFEGANPNPLIEGTGALPTRTNYLLGKDPSKWRTDIVNYARVQYREIYPGIDLVFYGNQTELEFDFVIRPGANPEAIRLGIGGANAVTIDEGGDLVLRVDGGEVRQHRPHVYQEMDGKREIVDGRFALVGKDLVSFQLGQYDRTRSLVVDPVLSYSTFLGGDDNSSGAGAIATDALGNAYVTGWTYASDFPLVGAVQGSLNGYEDVFVSKLNPTGTGLIYSTYIGGNSWDQGTAIAVDPQGRAYVAGTTSSSDFPLVQAAQSSGGQIFVLALNSDGNALAYSTRLGGTGYDSVSGIAVDSTGAAYLTGYTYSSDFPVTAGAYQGVLRGGEAGFVTKYTANGSVAYSTLLGGTIWDESRAIAVDSAGFAYITGLSLSSDYPTTPGAFQATSPGGETAFVTKLNPQGSGLVYSTFVGSAGSWSYGQSIGVDATGQAYVSGAAGGNFPITPGAFQSTPKGSYGGPVVFKMNAAGSALSYSTYLGGSASDNPQSIAVDAQGNAVVAGYAYSPDFPVLNAVQPQIGYPGRVLYRGANSGLTWTPSGSASDTFSPNVMVADPWNAGLLYGADSCNIYKTDAPGQWQYVGFSGNCGITDLIVDSQTLNVLYVNSYSGIRKSVDGGQNWTYVNNGLTNTYVNALVADPTDHNVLYAGTNSGIFKTQDGGANWSLLSGTNEYIQSIAVDPVTPATVYATSYWTLLVSTDRGTSFTSRDLPSSISYGSRLAVQPSDHSRLYAYSSTGVFVTGDAGTTWTNLGADLPPVTSFAISPSSSVIYAGTDRAGVYRNSLDGSEWTTAGNQPLNLSIQALCILPSDPTTVWAAGPKQPDVFVAKFDPSGSLLYSTFLGNAQGAYPGGVAIAPNGGAIIAGSANGSGFPVTDNALKTTGWYNAFVSRIDVAQPSCTYQVHPSTLNVGIHASVSDISVVAPSGCTWTLDSVPGWITTIADASGIGTGSSTFLVTTNQGIARTGTLTLGGQTVTINQPGYSLSLSPMSASFDSGQNSNWFYVSTNSSALWTTVSNVTWGHVTAGATGTGSGQVQYSVDANPSLTAGRTGTLTVQAGGVSSLFTINQSGSSCSAVTPIADVTSFSGAGGTVNVTVTSSTPTCTAWTPASDVSWITPVNANATLGNGSATYTVQPNVWNSPRRGNIWIAGVSIQIVQSAGSQCSAGPIDFLSPVSGVWSNSDCPSSWRSQSSGGTNYAKQYTFQGTANQQIAIELVTADIDTYLYLAGPDGTLVSQDDDTPWTVNSRIPYSGFFTLPSTGIYSIEATTYSSGATGAFTLQLVPGCPVTLLQTAVSASSAGGALTTPVVGQSGCEWTATAYTPSWLTVAPGTGAGIGSLTVTASDNSSGSTRTGAISIGGQWLMLLQGGSGSYGFSPDSASLSASGQNGSVLVAPPDSNYWYPLSTQPWLTIQSNGLHGVATLNYSVTENTGMTRSAQILIGSQAFTVTQAGTNPALRFVPITPCRVVDTRWANGAFGGPAITAGTSRDFVLQANLIQGSKCTIPATAQAYSLNVTVVPPKPLGYLTIWPTGQARPVASTLNSLDGRIKANAAIVPAGNSGAVSVFVSDTTQVLLDIDGYFVPATDASALAFYPLTPCRVADTRKALGLLGAPALGAGTSRTLPILSSSCGVPASAQAYSLNLTAVPGGALGYITTWPTGQPKPTVSTLNAPTGAITANAAIVPAGSGGSIDVFASDATNLVVDINGYFAPAGAGGLSLYNLPPCRVLDSRKPAGSPALKGAMDVDVVDSGCGAPLAAQAYVLNATVVPQASLGYLTLWPQGATQPVVSTLNALDGKITSNMAIVPTTNGSTSAFLSDLAHVVLDISGYFAQ